jgi:signal transduction histidine kinase
LFEHAACGLLLTDAAGLIVRTNASACALLGCGEEEVNSVAQIQIELRSRLGERIPVLINIVRRWDDGQVRDHWAIFRASDRRIYERELLSARTAAESALEARRDAEAELQRLNTQLSAADRRKDEFLATLSHELRNPLVPMRSALDVLKLKFKGEAPDRLLQAFDRQLRHLTRLVDDLIEVSRITQGRIQLRRAPVELSALVLCAAHDLSNVTDAARHTLHVEVAPPPVVVDGDATRLSQAVINLLTNAAKYTPDGGHIELRLDSEPGAAMIRVRDNGIGIQQSALATVFDMFAQLEPALERAKGGLDIGLALVRGIVELHDGSIRAESDARDAAANLLFGCR